MQVCGIIAEFNPFHRGHARLVETIHDLLPETVIISVMSGPFCQRGDAAILDKWARAEAARDAGVNAVFELHTAWATASLQTFAYGAIETLKATGLVSHLAFGSECGQVEELAALAGELRQPSDQFTRLLKGALADGAPFALAQQGALEAITGVSPLKDRPNDRLALSYLRYAPSHWQALAVQRDTQHDGQASGRAIRAALKQGQPVDDLLTPAALAQVEKAGQQGWTWPDLGDFYGALQLRLTNMSAEEVVDLLACTEGTAIRLKRAAISADSFEAWLDTALDRHLFESTLRRAALQVLSPVSPMTAVPYLRLLAADDQGRQLLKAMKGRARVPVIGNCGRDVKKLPPQAQAAFADDLRRQETSRLLQKAATYRQAQRDFHTPPVMT
ncbi:nucleotidyltransferase family protein [Peptococcus simiae]|uniref:nucleotidyltransferase family protein n=1 Tax=Peptococcus simiae TaxID=1643805 RepID=UPI003980E748